MTPLLAFLDIQLPIVQAPMAGVSTPAMAASVSRAGGLGSLGIGAMSVDVAREAIREARERGALRLNVNVFVHRSAAPDPTKELAWIERLRPEFERYGAKPPSGLSDIYNSFLQHDAMLAMLLAEKPAVVSFHFGVPLPAQLTALRDAGIILMASATSVAEARQLAAAGIDVVIAQGYEAGGHRGLFDPDAPDDQLSSFALTRILVRELDRPVIAAGGIMDGAGIGAALRIGAGAAQLGTAFINTPESLADDAFRAALTGSPGHHTIMTRAISGRPARCLANRFTALGAAVTDETVPSYPRAYDLGKALHAAAKAKGEFGYGAQLAGQGAPLSRAMPTEQLVRTLALELKAV